MRDRRADAATGAGDQRDLAGEPVHFFDLPRAIAQSVDERLRVRRRRRRALARLVQRRAETEAVRARASGTAPCCPA